MSMDAALFIFRLLFCLPAICSNCFTMFYSSLVVPFLRFGEVISGGPHFPLTSDAMKKVLTGHASREVLLSIVHAVSCHLLFLRC